MDENHNKFRGFKTQTSKTTDLPTTSSNPTQSNEKKKRKKKQKGLKNKKQAKTLHQDTENVEQSPEDLNCQDPMSDCFMESNSEESNTSQESTSSLEDSSDHEVIQSSQPQQMLKTPTITNQHNRVNETNEKTRTNKPLKTIQPKAQIDMNNADFNNNLPENTRFVHISSNDETVTLSKTNPLILKKTITELCGPIKNCNYLRTGALILECNTLEQVKKLLKTEILEFKYKDREVTKVIPIKTTISLAHQASYGKIYAPELTDMTLEEILDELADFGVISIRKLLRDPTKSHIPLYVVGFLRDACPTDIQIGFSNYKIDPYIPTPLRCFKCYKLGHSTPACKNKALCSNCSKTDHDHTVCTNNAKCINCKGDHGAFYNNCPILLKEQQICKIQSTQNISHLEARRQIQNQNPPISNLRQYNTNPTTSYNHQPLSGTNTLPILTQSNSEFPNITRNYTNQNINSPDPISQTINSTQNNYTQRETFSQITANPLPSLPPFTQQPPIGFEYSQPITPGQVTTLRSNYGTQQSDTNESTTPQIHTPNTLETTKQWIAPFLPIIIKLLLSNDLSTKLESLHELSSLLDMEQTFDSLITSLGLTSSKLQ